MRRRHALLGAVAAGSARGSSALPPLRLGATHWPPYLIGPGPRPGWLHEHVAALLLGMGSRLQASYLPWSRAQQMAREGAELDGLLSAVPSEAEGLRLTRVPSLHQQVVLLVRADSPWQWSGPALLPQLRLGVVADYGYGEPLDRHIRQRAGPLLALRGSDTATRLLQLLELDRVDAVVDDRHVLRWGMAQRQLAPQRFRELLAFALQPVFMALHPQLPDLDRWLERLDAALLQGGPQLAALRPRYF